MKTLIVISLIIASVLLIEAEPQKVNRVKGDLESISKALEMYKVNAGFYPSTKQGLKALVNRPNIAPRPRRWVMIFTKVPKDSWGSEYQYKLEAGKVHLWSKGAKLKDPKDDIYLPQKKEGEKNITFQNQPTRRLRIDR